MNLAQPKPISMQSIDTENLEEIEEIREAVMFSIILNTEPTPEWHQEFESAYKVMHHPIKPPVTVEDGRLWITYLPRYSAELPAYIKFLKHVVERANSEEIRTAHLRERDTGGHKAKFREVLKSISLT